MDSDEAENITEPSQPELYQKLLDIYQSSRRQTDGPADDILSKELEVLCKLVKRNGSNAWRSTYRRFHRLISMHRPALAEDPSLTVSDQGKNATKANSRLSSESFSGENAGTEHSPGKSSASMWQPDSSVNASITRIPRAGGYANGLNFCGIYDRYPDRTENRQYEGGLRLKGVLANSRPGRPLVTIVTALYNNHETLQRCIDSVRKQSYDNIEHIIIDGGSNQSTLSELRRNAGHLAYIVSEPDPGIYGAMNKGIELARGDYVCLLNSDDFYEPDFVESCIDAAMNSAKTVDIVYSDYHASGILHKAQRVDDGLLFGHLNVCHNTFLVSKQCYDTIGPYDEKFGIVSDAIWMRRAFLEGMCFVHVPKPLFTLSDGGASSGQTAADRNKFIREVVESYKICFPFLEHDHAETIYLFRFNRKRAGELIEVARSYHNVPEVQSALRSYAEYCLRERPNFHLSRNEDAGTLRSLLELGDQLELDPKCFNIETKQGPLARVLERIDEILARRKNGARLKILHYITVFSAPSETFVYDLLQRLDAEDDLDNFVLHEHALLREERPYSKAIQIFWSHFPEAIGRVIYRYLVHRLNPDLVIAHFAINEAKWSSRVRDTQISLPTISMCHGIDVFTLQSNAEYKSYICETFAQRDDTAFTVVSEYLRGELLSHGIDDSKVHLVPNSVNDRFFRHRKTNNFYDGSRPLELLCIGRLIDWKGHRFLLDALAEFSRRCTPEVQLTLVYARGDDELNNIKAQINSLGLQQKVILEPFVDFSKHPDYLARFDCYVHPSTYTSDVLRKSETFGVALLEAIAAGLPVITSDAGGLPEVVGTSGRYARIVPHANAEALAQALEEIWRDRTAFSDNLDFARQRLDEFSGAAQVRRLRKVMAEILNQPLRAALITTSTVQGAGYAAYRLHRGLRSTSIRPRLFTTVRNHEMDPDVTVVKHPTGDGKRWSALQLPPNPGKTIFTLNVPQLRSSEWLHALAPFDVINIHWHARFLSIENIATLTHSTKPVVLTVRDMMPISGGCHFFHGCTRWKDSCMDCPQFPTDQNDFPAAVLAAKRLHYKFENLTLVALSSHSQAILKDSPYFRDCRIEVIPNSIELDVFRPQDKRRARQVFGLPSDRKIIGYVPSFSSEVKGYRELVSALELLSESYPPGEGPFVMLVGNETPATNQISLDKEALGYIADNERLALAYSAADVIVVPSLEETFSNTTAEAIACGVPVVGFKTGAIPDLAINGKTGYCCEVGDVKGLADAIAQVLSGPDMSKACRQLAESELSFMLQARRYETLFRELRSSAAHPDGCRRSKPRVFECFNEPNRLLPRIMEERLDT